MHDISTVFGTQNLEEYLKTKKITYLRPLGRIEAQNPLFAN